MKQITLNIPDTQLAFFMELVQKLGIEVADQLIIPEEHKTIVRDRIKKAKKNPERLLDWDTVKDQFNM